MKNLFLATRSPRRHELIRTFGLIYTVVDVDLPEHAMPDETPAQFALRVAADKAKAGLSEVSADHAWVLGADTCVVIDDQILGKPIDRNDATAMLQLLSGRTHQVLTAVSLVSRERQLQRLSTSTVTFRTLLDEEIQAYVATGEPLDKAGSYAIQGLAAIFIRHLEGSYSGVMGLPLFETAELLSEAGFTILR